MTAMAETQVYGKAHVSIDMLSDVVDADQDSDGDGTNDDVGMFISSNSSNIGFKGDVDAVYASVSNDDAAALKVASGGHGAKSKVSAVPGEANSGFSVGTVYKF